MTIVLILFILGAIIGSFLNVVGLRYRSGVTLGGRSFCPHCHKTLSWWELIPIASFLGLHGRCAGCNTKISWQYPIVEFATGVVFASFFITIGPNNPIAFVYYLLAVIIFCLYIAIVIYDMHHMIIPDAWIYPAILLSLMARFVIGGTPIDWLAGPILFAFFAAIWLVSRGRAMGFGDAKLALSIGLLLGFSEGLTAIVLAFWIGSIVALFVLFAQKFSLFKKLKQLNMKSEIPFAPFLVIGAWIALAYSFSLFYAITF